MCPTLAVPVGVVAVALLLLRQFVAGI